MCVAFEHIIRSDSFSISVFVVQGRLSGRNHTTSLLEMSNLGYNAQVKKDSVLSFMEVRSELVTISY